MGRERVRGGGAESLLNAPEWQFASELEAEFARRATGWVAACSKGGGVIAQSLSILALVPPLGITAAIIMVPTALAFALLIWFGKETRGRDLRDLDDTMITATSPV